MSKTFCLYDLDAARALLPGDNSCRTKEQSLNALLLTQVRTPKKRVAIVQDGWTGPYAYECQKLLFFFSATVYILLHVLHTRQM